MKNYISLKLWLIAGLLFTVSSCDNFVDVELPNSQLTAPAVFEDMATANAAMTSIYSNMRDKGMLTGAPLGLSQQLGNYADELDFYGYPQSSTNFYYLNALTPSLQDIKSLWTESYNQIYAANAVIYGAENSTTLSAANKNQLRGEALFVRAFLHFYLVNLFGDIPYITTTDYEVNSTVSRMPAATVYGLIKADLAAALDLLSQDYLSSNRVRPNKLAARSVLARVNLYMGNWDEASNDASAVINATDLYSIETNIDAAFLKTNPSTIWQFSPALSSNNTEEGSTFLFTSGPPPMSALTNTLVNSFDTADLRKTHWIGNVTDGTTTWYYANKYKNMLTEGGSMEHSIVLRLEEQYLIRAEARAHQGNLTGAKDDLDKIRTRAGLPNTAAVTDTELIAAVLEERKLEFFTEMGHRFFDLKRTNNLNSVLGTVKLGWQNTDKLLPLPVSELTLNPNLAPQNPGY
ncbi:MAG: RagB/SusD family nutrient uptake outer membrane protein [Flavobacterium sp.]